MKEYVRTIADYPVKGIQFRDITTLLQNAGHFKQVIDDMVKPWQNKKIDAITLKMMEKRKHIILEIVSAAQ